MKQQYDALLGAPVMSIVCTSLLTSSILPAPTRHYPAGLPWPQKWNRKSSVQLPLPLHSANKSIFTLLESQLSTDAISPMCTSKSSFFQLNRLVRIVYLAQHSLFAFTDKHIIFNHSAKTR